MYPTAVFNEGGYRYIPSVFQDSGGVAAEPGFQLEQVRFTSLVPIEDAFLRIEEHLKKIGRPLTAFAHCELRSPMQFDDQGFIAFNRKYVSTLERWGIYQAESSGRSFINPVGMYSFTYTVPANTDAHPSFVISGGGDARSGPEPYRERIIAYGDCSEAGLKLKMEFVVNEMLRIGAHHFNSRRFCGIKRARFHHRIGIEIPTIKFRVDGGRQPDKAAAHALTQCEAELKFRARLVDFVHHERVLAANIPVLKPAPRDPRGHNHHIPTRRFGRRFALAIDDAHAQVFGAEQFLRDWFYAERLAGAGARDDPKATARLGDGRFEVMRAEPFGEFAELDAAGFPQHRLEVEREGELDCLARGACGRDDDDTARLPRSDKGVVIGREIRVADVA